MAIAHVCLHCGHDLAELEPRTDPHYALPLVWCPACARPSCRRTHPVSIWWQAFRSTGWAAGWLVVKIGAGVALIAATIAAVPAATPDVLLGRSFEPWYYTASVIGAVAFAHGIWISAALSHFRLHVAWLGWAAAVYAALAFVVAVDRLVSPGPIALSRDLLPHSIAVATLLAASAIGMPFGFAYVTVRDAVRRERNAGSRSP